MVRHTPLGNSMNVHLTLSRNIQVRTDLNKDLDIDPRNLREELISQPAKYALWSTATRIAHKRVEFSEEDFFKSSGGTTHKEDYNLVSTIRDAFLHRKSALMKLSKGNSADEVMTEYYKNLSNLRAVLGMNTQEIAHKN